MTINAIIIVVALVVLAILFMLTMLNVLAHDKTHADAAWDELDKAWIKRRDTVPYLLESVRLDDGRWEALKEKRAELLRNDLKKEERLKLEEELGNAIEAMIAIAREHKEIRQDTGFLEAEKDLRKDIPAEIDIMVEKFKKNAQDYNDKTKKF